VTAIFHDSLGKPAPECLHYGFLLEPRLTEVASGGNWSHKTCKAPVKSSPPTYNYHAAFFTGRMPFLLANRVRALKGELREYVFTDLGNISRRGR